MKIIKEVKIKISSSIENLDSAGMPEGECERTESECAGYLHLLDGESFVTYKEKDKNGEVTSEIRISEESVFVIRHGAIESNMEFREGEITHSIYGISPYTFDMSLDTRRIRRRIGEDGGEIHLIYNMKVGGAEKSVRMKIWILPISSRG